MIQKREWKCLGIVDGGLEICRFEGQRRKSFCERAASTLGTLFPHFFSF
jgi:hypothetical protein